VLKYYGHADVFIAMKIESLVKCMRSLSSADVYEFH
jgi:hypothetical protein